MEIFISILFILIAHFIADFVFQPHYLAISKSHDIKNLTYHVIIYTLSFFLIFLASWYFMFHIYNIGITATQWLQIVLGITLVNGLLHFIIDFVTSKISSYFWNKKDNHNFFVIIGFDQLLHTGLLVISFAQMLQNINYI